MFQIRALSKYLTKPVLIAVGLVILLTPALAAASGESYSWTDASNQTVTASGGSYSATFTLTQTSQDAQSVDLFGSTTLQCAGQPTQVTVELSIAVADYQKTYPTPAQVSLTPACPGVTVGPTATITASPAATGTGTAAGQQPASCNQGSFSWLVCPLTAKISDTISSITEDALTPLLQVQPLSAHSTPGLYQAWSNIKDFAELLFVVIFIIAIIASATSAGLDSYTIKRLLPRLVAAAILIQFSFFICAVLVDTGNVLGGGIQDLILANFQSTANTGNSILANLGTITVGLVGAVALSFLITLPILLMLLLSVLAFLLTLAARYMIIAVFVAISPLAILAWVLPNTSSYFKKWATQLVRLIMMYPIIMGILAIGRRITEILGFTNQATTNNFSNTLTDIIKPFIIIAIFLAIPQTFKWAGGAMSMVQGRFNGLAGMGRKQVKESDWYKDKKEQQTQRRVGTMNQLANSHTITSLSGSNSRLAQRAGKGLLAGAGLAIGGTPWRTLSEPLARQRALQSGQSTFAKELEDLPTGSNPGILKDLLKSVYGDTAPDRSQARARLLQNAPELEKYTRTAAGRMAAIKRLESLGSLEGKDISQILRNGGAGEYGLALRAAQPSFAKIPVALARFDGQQVDGSGRQPAAGTLNAAALESILKNLNGNKLKDDFSAENYNMAAADSQAARVIAANAPAAIFGNAFKAGAASYVDVNRRNAIIDMIAAQRAEFRSANGQALRSQIIDTIRSSDESYLEATSIRLRIPAPVDPATGGPIPAGTPAYYDALAAELNLRLN